MTDQSTVELAGEADVIRMRRAAAGLDASALQSALAAAGITAPKGLRSVPKAEVTSACRFLGVASRTDPRSPVAAYISGHSDLEHRDCLDSWPASRTDRPAPPDPTGYLARQMRTVA